LTKNKTDKKGKKSTTEQLPNKKQLFSEETKTNKKKLLTESLTIMDFKKKEIIKLTKSYF
jgi:predicted Mrr-cat superfamily restriction endonuclease